MCSYSSSLADNGFMLIITGEHGIGAGKIELLKVEMVESSVLFVLSLDLFPFVERDIFIIGRGGYGDHERYQACFKSDFEFESRKNI